MFPLADSYNHSALPSGLTRPSTHKYRTFQKSSTSRWRHWQNWQRRCQRYVRRWPIYGVSTPLAAKRFIIFSHPIRFFQCTLSDTSFCVYTGAVARRRPHMAQYRILRTLAHDHLHSQQSCVAPLEGPHAAGVYHLIPHVHMARMDRAVRRIPCTSTAACMG